MKVLTAYLLKSHIGPLVFAFVARETVQWTSRRVLRNQVAG